MKSSEAILPYIRENVTKKVVTDFILKYGAEIKTQIKILLALQYDTTVQLYYEDFDINFNEGCKNSESKRNNQWD